MVELELVKPKAEEQDLDEVKQDPQEEVKKQNLGTLDIYTKVKNEEKAKSSTNGNVVEDLTWTSHYENYEATNVENTAAKGILIAEKTKVEKDVPKVKVETVT